MSLLPSQMRPVNRNDRKVDPIPQPEPVVTGWVPCPICRARTPVAGDAGRCPECTVRVKLVGSKVKANGYWFGGDMRKAGAALASRRLTKLPTPDARCSTYAGAQAHRRRDEICCTPCRTALSAYKAAARARKKVAA